MAAKADGPAIRIWAALQVRHGTMGKWCVAQVAMCEASGWLSRRASAGGARFGCCEDSRGCWDRHFASFLPWRLVLSGIWKVRGKGQADESAGSSKKSRAGDGIWLTEVSWPGDGVLGDLEQKPGVPLAMELRRLLCVLALEIRWRPGVGGAGAVLQGPGERRVGEDGGQG
ncbi:hypothetical protein Taro_000893 [Colocasia esculenta]|uniref:Uncharacterized protein n=1 Tax=Colocasia esculenta TaxID=4460 RepID=A0A843TGA0_COLES|nr:hypothetical protein [Colocasia esculenta]